MPVENKDGQECPSYAGRCSMKFQVSPAPAALPHSTKKLDGDQGAITYAEGVIAGSPGLQCEASKGHSPTTRYPEGVIADRERFGNNAFSVEEQDDLNPGVARFALQPWATRSNAFGVGTCP